MSNPYITLGLMILLPIIPAYLLFRALPSTGNVEGKLFKGLEIKLGGAFAGYFAVLLLIFYKHDIWAPPATPPVQTSSVWHLSGQVLDASGAPIEPLDIKDFSFSPPTFQAMPGGNFDMMIPTQPQEGGGIKYPTLFINHGDYVPLQIPLDPSQLSADLADSLGVSRDATHNEMRMKHIVLKAAPPYRPTGTPPERETHP